jgi:uncharacterized membrane protein
MLVLAYFAEGVVRTISENGIGRSLAALETILALSFFGLAVAYARATGRHT